MGFHHIGALQPCVAEWDLLYGKGIALQDCFKLQANGLI